MSRVLRIPMSPEVPEVVDSTGRKWKGLVEEGPESGKILVLTEQEKWHVFVEGITLGSRMGDDPAEVLHSLFKEAGLTSMPEAVAVKVVGDSETWVIFGLEGKLYKVPLEQFSKEVEKSSLWVRARQAKRPEIDALMKELK